MPESAEQTSATGGAETTSGGGAAEQSTSVSPEALKAAVAEALDGIKAGLSQEITGATKRQVSDLLKGIDLDALRANAAPDKSSDKGKDKVNPLEVKVGELEKRQGELQAEADRYKQRAIRGQVTEAVSKAKVHEHVSPLLIDQLSALAREDDKGNLFVPGANDAPVPLSDYLTDYLKDKGGMLQSDARSGTGAGPSAGGFTEPMPASKCALMYRHEPDPYSSDGKTVCKQTPERMLAYIEAHGKAKYDALPAGTMADAVKG